MNTLRVKNFSIEPVAGILIASPLGGYCFVIKDPDNGAWLVLPPDDETVNAGELEGAFDLAEVAINSQDRIKRIPQSTTVRHFDSSGKMVAMGAVAYQSPEDRYVSSPLPPVAKACSICGHELDEDGTCPIFMSREYEAHRKNDE